MNKNIARILCLVLALLLSVAVFSGCKAKEADATSSTADSEEVTSIAPPVVEKVVSAGYTVAEGSTIVTVVKDNTTNVTTMKVATGTALSVFKQAVTASEGYSYKIFDAAGVEITDDAAIIADSYQFKLYKDGENEATETYTISVVTEAEIISTNSEVAAEESRYESQVAEESSRQAAQSEADNNLDTTSGGRSGADISSTTASSQVYEPSVLNGYTFDYKTDDTNINVVSNDTNNRFHTTVDKMVSDYGMNFNIDPDAGAITANSLVNAVMAGEKYADVVVTQLNAARAMAKAGAIADFNLATNLDLDASCFNSAVGTGMTFQGKTYAIAFTAMGTNPMGVTFNKNILSLYAPDYDIYQMYKDGSWNVDAYTEIIKECSRNLDSNPNTNEIYGMTSNTNVIGIALSSFAGGTASKDSSGYVYPCFTNNAGIQSLEWCKNAFNNNYWKYIADIYESINFFAAGSAATVVTYMWAVSMATSAADFEIGFVPFPKAGNQTDYITQTYDCPVFVVPKTNAANIDKVGAVLNELAVNNDANVNSQVEAYQNVGLDDIGCSVFRWALTNTTPDLSGGVYSSVIDTAITNAVMKASSEPASAMAGIADEAAAETDDYYGVLTGQG